MNKPCKCSRSADPPLLWTAAGCAGSSFCDTYFAGSTSLLRGQHISTSRSKVERMKRRCRRCRRSVRRRIIIDIPFATMSVNRERQQTANPYRTTHSTSRHRRIRARRRSTQPIVGAVNSIRGAGLNWETSGSVDSVKPRPASQLSRPPNNTICHL